MSVDIERVVKNIKVERVERTIAVRRVQNTIAIHDGGRRGEKGDPGDPASNLVTSVNGKQGVVVLDTDDIADTAANRYTNDTDITRLANTSGNNTGDQDLSGYAQTSSLATVATTGDYDDLSNKPTIPTKTSDLTNDSSFITSAEVTSFETVSKNLKAWDYTLNYTLNKLTTISYTAGAETITKTLGYTGDQLTTITLSGDTPSGIELVKTLTYTGDSLTGVAYA